MEFVIRQTVYLARENNVLHYAQPMEYGDACAHRWMVTINTDGAEADLGAMSAKCFVTRAASDAERAQGITSVTLTQDAEIDAQTSTVSCVFDAACYGGVGAFAAIMRVSDTAGATVTAAKMTACLRRSTSDAVYDPEGLLPSLDALLAQIATIEAATASAKTATENANAATESANTAASNAQEKAVLADTAAKGASGWANATMTATALETGSEPTVNVTTASDGHKVITVGIPRGNTGATPQISVEVSTGAAGSEALVSVSGTAENPVIHLTIPRGNTGAIENLKINGKPVESGTIKLNASDVGALASDGTAADSSKLGGKTWAERLLDIYPIGSIYMSVNSTSPASLFGGTWEQLKDRFLLGAGSTYSAGSTGGAQNVTLTMSQIPEHTIKIREATSSGENTGYRFTATSGTYSMASYLETVGGGESHDNMPPYLAVYMWKRVS